MYMYVRICVVDNVSLACTLGQIELLEESLTDAQERITELEGEDNILIVVHCICLYKLLYVHCTVGLAIYM